MAFANTSLTNAKISMTLSWLYQNTLDQNNAKYTHSYTFSDKLTNGTAVDQAEIAWWDERNAAITTGDILNLYNSGTLVDAFGNALVMTKLKGFFIENRDTAIAITISSPATNGIPLFSDGGTMTLPPGAMMFWWNPAALSPVAINTTRKNLAIISASGTPIYRVGVIGLTT